MTIIRFAVAPFLRSRFHDCLMARSCWATFENIEYSFNFKGTNMTQIKVSQQIAACSFANLKWTLDDLFFVGTPFDTFASRSSCQLTKNPDFGLEEL